MSCDIGALSLENEPRAELVLQTAFNEVHVGERLNVDLRGTGEVRLIVDPLSIRRERGVQFRFVMVKARADEGNEPQIVVVRSWFEGLRRLVPVN